jgi:hypothetical protein
LKETPKPEKMSVKQWINWIKNIPVASRMQYRLAKLHLKAKIDDIISNLALTEENIKTHQKSN